ncbi:ECM14 protein [Plectosphaerella plurivora]|uniref:ECM14 protein n=1 Tax=Plectosphaerella plurivora TaxID=936078 RepID=A0A9P8VL45_9PEZI|nr:ECM14 protein [Plectosphaerella plurivora]
MKFLAGTLALASLAFAAEPLGPLAPREDRVSYDGYHVYRLRAETPAAIEALEARLEGYPSMHSRDTLEVAVPPSEVRRFEALGLEARLMSSDLGQQMREEAIAPVYRRDLERRGDLPDLSWFQTYHPYDDHLDFWDDLVEAFPNNSKKINLGPSYEGRDIYAYHLWGDEGDDEQKPALLWHGTVHAREWISTMVVEYLTWKIINGYKTGDPEIKSVLDTYSLHIVPFHNPDGFVYTQTTQRLWRKNRQPRRNTTCIGTDNNRNWNFQWYAEPPEGSVSTNPCAETFKGRCPGDTPENVAVSALSHQLAARPAGIRSYVDWHSYSQLILTPWGWSCEPEDLPVTLPRMLEVANGVAGAIYANSGKNYTVGPACEVLYSSSGTGRDFHHGATHADHSWTLELRPATAREGGFVLPPAQILETVEEQWAGQRWLFKNVKDN